MHIRPWPGERAWPAAENQIKTPYDNIFYFKKIKFAMKTIYIAASPSISKQSKWFDQEDRIAGV
jgi:hypothetical protein